MRYELTLKPAFLAGLVRIGQHDQKKVVRAVKTLGENPFQAWTAKILKQSYKNLYRLRVGDCRLVCAVGANAVALLDVGKRSEIYDRLLPLPRVAGVCGLREIWGTVRQLILT